MKTTVILLMIVLSSLAIASCTCSYCEKLKYVDTQTTIEAEVQKEAVKLSTKSNLTEQDIIASLTALLSGNSRIFGVAYATAPYDENMELIETYYVFREGDKTKTKHEKAYNFMTSQNSNWYRKPYLHKKAMWSIPYYDFDRSGEKYYLTTYSYPLIENGKVKFIFTADYLLNIKE
ncbi:MAG: PDC sensor domain-containing protein [Candidatus Cloacimonetes bacterium]|nr:PDC sensor domain-containing protein [Candidatus Cloacimonadota bacterium]